ncbi:MAG: cation diffusion facilitator family transporter [Candidatus Omnitrophica bacterium]|nr:cation diffusion facilitator family transporter [Candidatus Omnitrophota bacterium]
MKHFHRPKQTESVADELFEYKSVEKKKLKISIAITLITMLVEIVGGFLTNSLALISDAGHMFTHLFALSVSTAAIACANRPVCHHRTFGFYRIEILAAHLNSLFIFAVTIWIFIEGVQRIIHPKQVIGMEMFIIAFIGLVVNLVTAWILHGATKESLNIKSAFVHMLADTLSSVAIVIGAIIIYFTKWNIIDPVISIVITFFIAAWGWGLFRDSANILLEAAPKGMDTDQIRKVLLEEINEIEEISDLHVWEITSKMYSMTAHVKIKGDEKCVDVKKILSRIKQIVNEKFDIEHTTIELD